MGDGPKQDHVFREFGGINTQAKRQAIQPGEFAWIENIQPIGYGNLRIVPGRSAALQTVASGDCYYMADYNINGGDYMLMATDNGHVYQVLLDSPYTRTEIGSGFQNSGVQIAQWKNDRILIVDGVGYFSWDGTTLTETGQIVAATVTAGGSYTAVPTWTVTGGGGAGGAVTSIMGLAGAQTITAAGTGYVAGDIITLVGGTSTVVGKLRVVTVGGGGSVTGVSIFQAGSYTAFGVAPLATTGAGNDDCTITPAYTVIGLTVTNGGTVPYADAPTLTASAGAATADAIILESPTNPQHIATYVDQVWITSGRTLNYTAPGSYYDFSGAGSGITTINDEVLHSDITQIIAANGFLYFTGEHSINVIGNVQINSDGDTVFSNTNLDATIGTDEENSLLPYFRSVWMFNRAGVYMVYGSSPQKASDALDGIVENIDFTEVISSGVFFLRNIMCACFLVQYDDPDSGVSRPLLLVFFNKKWFVASQGADLIFITGGEANSSASLYGTDGTSLFKLFADDDEFVDWTFSTKFWDMGDVVRGKQVTKFGFEATLLETQGSVLVELETLSSVQPYTSVEEYPVDVTTSVIWLNSSDEEVQWEDSSGDFVTWLSAGYFMNMQDGSEFGKYLGATLSSDDVRGTITSFMLEYTFRERW